MNTVNKEIHDEERANAVAALLRNLADLLDKQELGGIFVAFIKRDEAGISCGGDPSEYDALAEIVEDGLKEFKIKLAERNKPEVLQ